MECPRTLGQQRLRAEAIVLAHAHRGIERELRHDERGAAGGRELLLKLRCRDEEVV
jgi:hypothetical protein